MDNRDLTVVQHNKQDIQRHSLRDADINTVGCMQIQHSLLQPLRTHRDFMVYDIRDFLPFCSLGKWPVEFVGKSICRVQAGP